MNRSREKLLNESRELGRERKRLLRRLQGESELAVGTVSTVKRKCGKPGCRCATGAGHPQTLFLFKDERGRRRCKLVRRADEKRLLRAGERYRRFRADLKRLRAIDAREKEILMALKEMRALKYE